MTRPIRLATAVWVLLPAAAAQTAILQLQVLEGDNAVLVAGSRTGRPFLVQVTDETGRPVEGVAVSFRLPEEEPSGVFRNGLKTDVVVTGADGRAGSYGLTWGAVPGTARVRITAAKDQARAGAVLSVYLSEASAAPGVSAGAAHSKNRPIVKGNSGLRRLILLSAAAGGGLGLGIAQLSRKKLPAQAAQSSTVQLGTPVITVGRP